MEHMVLISVLFGVSGMTLFYLAARLVVVAVKLFRIGNVVDSLLLLVVAFAAVALVATFGNEKTLLVVAILSWIYLAVAFIRFVLRIDNDAANRKMLSRVPGNNSDPNSLSYSGVGPGFQGFGMYAHGVRVGNEPIDDNS